MTDIPDQLMHFPYVVAPESYEKVHKILLSLTPTFSSLFSTPSFLV